MNAGFSLSLSLSLSPGLWGRGSRRSPRSLACAPFRGQGCPCPLALSRYGSCLSFGSRCETSGSRHAGQAPDPTYPSLPSQPRSLPVFLSLSLSLSLALSSELVPFETQTLVGNLCSRNRKIATINTGH